MWNKYCEVSELKGKVLVRCEDIGDHIVFETVDGEVYNMYHSQDCCESVYIESIAGELSDLVGSEILMAEEVSNEAYEKEHEPRYAESYTWTFYKFATIKGYVDIRWFGSSNGYYSESVSFYKD